VGDPQREREREREREEGGAWLVVRFFFSFGFFQRECVRERERENRGGLSGAWKGWPC
jgi:hypothetical protein